MIYKSFWEIEKRDGRMAWMFGMIRQPKSSDTVDQREFRTTLLPKMFANRSSSMIKPVNDQRGKHIAKHALVQEDLDLIDAYIESTRQ